MRPRQTTVRRLALQHVSNATHAAEVTTRDAFQRLNAKHKRSEEAAHEIATLVDGLEDGMDKHRLRTAVEELVATQESEARTMKVGVEAHHRNHATVIINFMTAIGKLTGKNFKKTTVDYEMEVGVSKASETKEE